MSWAMLPASLHAALRAARGVLRWYWPLFALIPVQLLSLLDALGYPRYKWIRAAAYLFADVLLYIARRNQKRGCENLARELARSRERMGREL